MYNVPVDHIRRHNNLHTDEIYFHSKIIIPNPKRQETIDPDVLRQDKIEKTIRKLKLGDDKENLAPKLLD